MRFTEFNLTEAASSKYYTIGDGHAVAIANAANWPTMAKSNTRSSDPSNVEAIKQIPAGSVVVISLGHDDAINSTDSGEQIASRIQALINLSKSQGQNPVYIMFPTGNAKDAMHNKNVRDIIRSHITIPNFDLEDAGTSIDTVSSSEYHQVADAIQQFVKPTNSVVNINTHNKVVSSTSTGTSSKGGSISHTQVASYLHSKGLDKNHVLGILANIEAESHFNPGAYIIDSNGLPSGGLFQHNGPRFNSMVAAAGGKKSWRTNWQAQVDFALSEPKGQEYIQKRFNSPSAASKWWTIFFEVPADKFNVAQNRVANLSRFV